MLRPGHDFQRSGAKLEASHHQPYTLIALRVPVLLIMGLWGFVEYQKTIKYGLLGPLRSVIGSSNGNSYSRVSTLRFFFLWVASDP